MEVMSVEYTYPIDSNVQCNTDDKDNDKMMTMIIIWTIPRVVQSPLLWRIFSLVVAVLAVAPMLLRFEYPTTQNIENGYFVAKRILVAASCG